MKDTLGREIDYMRISITDRCNLHCRYCMPEVQEPVSHEEILRYEEILRICKGAVELGIHKFKITGGEPLVRKGAVDFIGRLKMLPGVKYVTLTTNGTLLYKEISGLKKAGLDGVNISIDAVSPQVYQKITGRNAFQEAEKALYACVKSGLQTRINTVLLDENETEWLKLAAFAGQMPVDVRFIELMPIGCAGKASGPSVDHVYEMLKERYEDLHMAADRHGNGPAVYFKSKMLAGSIGFIGANSHRFCSRCNRIRLTSTGELKPCLSYEESISLRKMIRNGADDIQLKNGIKQAILAKPAAHCFSGAEGITERRPMNQIGG